MDTELFKAINELAKDTAWLHGTARFYATTLGPALLALLVLAAVWVARGRPNVDLAKAGWAGLAPLIAVPLNQPLVHAFNRPRPYNSKTLHDVLLLTQRGADASFPSDHSVLAGSVLAALWLLDRRLGAAATVVGVLLAVSRVYVGAHYPGDVLAGLTVGAVVALLGWRLLGGFLTSLVARIRATRLGALLTA